MSYPKSELPDCVLYPLEAEQSTGFQKLIASTPETRSICNDTAVMGIRYTRNLEKACSRILTALQAQKELRIEENETLVLHILRGGLNFGLREALFSAFGWNRHGASFISAQRARVDDDPEHWHIIESEYSKVYMPRVASIVIGDVVATGTSLEHAMQALIQEAIKQGTCLRSILFFTFGGVRAEEILEKTHRMCRDRFQDYEKTTLIYLEGRFTVPSAETPLSIKLTGTDLLRWQAQMAPEFIASQYEHPAFPLQRCAIYDAGSRAFWTPEYVEDVKGYWKACLNLAQSGKTFNDFLEERFPGLDAEPFGNVDIVSLCREEMRRMEAL
ncbi:hypothetical protein OOT00_06820 [Desulfobotulus sp. H1]|uniref:Phosphoribosyltransferase n=1 Tax=Desulfobotulus pelophilus TaxID=2823377 RepID=A0ABT3N8B0_9BACT|nr:hypothetical protein [Desulfobotulus pelophilus]MCW7753696.1 hypothetical protein [Desulfobotulus pelophilus]